MFNFLKNTIYVKIEPENISLLHVESGSKFSDIPVLAIDTGKGKSTVIAVGSDALKISNKANITISNGFKHPRTLLADFTIAEKTLKHFVRKVQPRSFFKIAPVVVIHPLSMLEGGLTQIEIRAFAELASIVGAQKVFIWNGNELTRDQLLDLSFIKQPGLLFPQ